MTVLNYVIIQGEITLGSVSQPTEVRDPLLLVYLSLKELLESPRRELVARGILGVGMLIIVLNYRR